MGYSVHLVRPGRGRAADSRFGRDEWDRLRASGRLPDWIYFEDGAITVKSPTPEQVVAFVGLARFHGWSVRGDDGETYDTDGVPVPAPADSGFLAATLGPLRDLFARRSIRRSMRGVVCPFQVATQSGPRSERAAS